MSNKIVHLNRHDPTVESVITRLYQDIDQIKAITCVIDWEDEVSSWCGDQKTLRDMSYHATILQNACNELLNESKDYEQT